MPKILSKQKEKDIKNVFTKLSLGYDGEQSTNTIFMAQETVSR